MTPTDAQIEAATTAMAEAHIITGRRPTRGQFRALARIGLTAAMQHVAPEPEQPIGAVTPATEL